MDKQAVINALERHLGKDLAFLAPGLGEALVDVVQARVHEGLAPYHRHAQERQREEYNSKLDALRATMDRDHPGWEKYDQDMGNAAAFLASSALEHPKFGNKFQLLHRLITSTLAPEEPPRPSSQSMEKKIASAKTNDDAFALAVKAALQEVGLPDAEQE